MSNIIMNTKTGEIDKEIKDGDIIKVIRKESLDYLDTYETWVVERFFKGNISEIEKLLTELTIGEKALLFFIVPFIGYNDCCIKHRNNSCMNIEDIIQKTGISKPTVHKSINSLIKKDILYKGKNSKEVQIFINPWLFCKGNRINKVLKTMFKNYKIKVMNNTKWKDLKQ
jgi:DNA-binding MarR family transcriptional regulator